MSEPSKTQVRKAGRLLRDFHESGALWLGLSGDERDAVERAYDIVDSYRSSFAAPINKVRMGLLSFVKTCGYPNAEVAQRNKRLARILQKLVRYPNMNITTMQDIGGCRVILPDLNAVDTLRTHIHGRWGPDIVDEDDYISSPQASGYRAVHVIVRRDDRAIEVQLRTIRQHLWADAVEAVSRQAGVELKWGRGPERVMEVLFRLADAMAALDRGEPIPSDLRETLARILAVPDSLA